MATCEICHVGDMSDSHRNTDLHRFNYLLHEWENYRKKIAKDKQGISVSFSIRSNGIATNNYVESINLGTYTLTISSQKLSSVNNTLFFELKVTNDRKEDVVYIMKATVLVPYNAFHIEDERNTIDTNEVIELGPKMAYSYKVSFILDRALNGSYVIPVAFTFQVGDSEEGNGMYSFSVAREIIIFISDFEDTPPQGKSPFKSGKWTGILVTIPPVESRFVNDRYEVPKRYRRIMMCGLNTRLCKPEEMSLLNRVRNIYQPNDEGIGTLHPTADNYEDFFRFLLWIDEMGQRLMLERYNMSEVSFVVRSNILELEVPGLAEKRPSLVSGDVIKIRVHDEKTVYQGIVKKINDTTIDIHQVQEALLDIIANGSHKFDVAFEGNRLAYERMHKAVDQCAKSDLIHILFPSEQLLHRNLENNVTINRFFNRRILENEEQRIAVQNILKATSGPAPYIVFGPPGTGKTLTIVEAILQIKENLPNSRILVCAPANAACDMLTDKLLQYITNKTDLIRVHTENRIWEDVPERIINVSNVMDGKFFKIQAKKLMSYRIVVTTLCLIGKYCGRYHADHVFIDEAAQALEPEADIAISMLTYGKQLVLAGDPKQLGPLCASAAAAKLKLDISLLERLMETNSLYTNQNTRFITMLKLNYRAHPEVLEVPNRLFYGNQLRAVNADAANDPIARTCIHAHAHFKSKELVNGSPVEFCSVMAEERREGKSPSYFNESEIQMIVKYIDAIFALPTIKVLPNEIGIITPYIRQVHRIKNRLQNRGYREIEVGTTEVFQGREKRIIIISTVRSKHSLLLIDQKYKLGFVKNEKRMNVALTRAMSKLIVIGNPHVLGSTYNPRNQGEEDRNWEFYIEFCESRGSFFGTQYLRRTSETRNDIIARFANIHLNQGHVQNS